MEVNTIRACSIWRALDVVGDVPVLLIMERAWLGARRFEEFVAQTQLARSVVSGRLSKLVEARIFSKELAEGGHVMSTNCCPWDESFFPLPL